MTISYDPAGTSMGSPYGARSNEWAPSSVLTTADISRAAASKPVASMITRVTSAGFGSTSITPLSGVETSPVASGLSTGSNCVATMLPGSSSCSGCWL